MRAECSREDLEGFRRFVDVGGDAGDSTRSSASRDVQRAAERLVWRRRANWRSHDHQEHHQGNRPSLLASMYCNQPPKANSAFHPSWIGKWVPALAGKARAGIVHSLSGCTQGVQVKLWDPLRTRAIDLPERLRGVFTTRRYTNLRLLYLTISFSVIR